MSIHIKRNNLGDAGSPYLLQHRDNPVHWQQWSEEIFNIAVQKDRLVIISIGYSACHWCHVMEHESFSQPEVAELMNDHFISIKVDREERPDVDRIYMNAAILMNGQGGWPLNVVALPDGRPVFAGTYFHRQQWMNLLNRLRQLREEQPKMLDESALSITSAILKLEKTHSSGVVETEFSREQFRNAGESILGMMDPEHGGFRGSPKFPLPSAMGFLLDFSSYTGNGEALNAVVLTLERMAGGGIYDQIGGGFSRYSTDGEWKVPHFEKMLYDNAQLMGLYSDAFRCTGNETFRRIVYGTYSFLMREMCSGSPGDGSLFFYSGLDADSEGVEGKYYVWSEEELDRILGEDASEIKGTYHVTPGGNWEHGKNIFFRLPGDSPDTSPRIEALLKKLLSARENRIPPALDHKMVTAWNCLAVMGLIKSWQAFGDRTFLERALECGVFLRSRMMKEEGGIFRIFDPKKNQASINGFLDDIAFAAAAFISIYRETFDETWIHLADRLTVHALEEFYSEAKSLFYYTSRRDPDLIVRSSEVQDNVIPSSNSVMADNLIHLGIILGKEQYIEISRGMLRQVSGNMETGGFSYSHWLSLAGKMIYGPVEVTVTGPEAGNLAAELNRNYLPQSVLWGGGAGTQLESVKEKVKDDETLIHVCRDRVCLAPVKSVAEALELL